MTLSERNAWSTRTIRRPDRPTVEWLRLGTLGEPAITVGVLRDGSWVIDTADGLADLGDAKALTLAFPVLNSSIREISERLAEFQRCSEISNFQRFPLARLVVHAIASGGFWAEQSFPWLLEIQFDECEKIAVTDHLRAIENNNEFSQLLRHKARRFRREMQ